MIMTRKYAGSKDGALHLLCYAMPVEYSRSMLST